MDIRNAIRTLGRSTAVALISGSIAIAVATPAAASGGGGTPVPGQAKDCTVSAADAAMDATETGLANQINAYRASKGLPALRVDATLAKPAAWASIDSAKRGFSPPNHVDTLGRDIPTRVRDCGHPNFGWVTEINYYGYGTGGSAAAALAWWKQSPGHNALLLDPKVKVFGIAKASGAQYQHWTINFADR